MHTPDTLRPLLLKLNGDDGPGAVIAEIGRSYDFRIAVACLLVQAGHVDGAFVPAERARVLHLLIRRLALEADDAEALLAAVDRPGLPGGDLRALLLVLAETLDAPGRVRFLEMLWDVVISDHRIEASEALMLKEVGALLGVAPAAAARIEAAYRQKMQRRKSGSQSPQPAL